MTVSPSLWSAAIPSGDGDVNIGSSFRSGDCYEHGQLVALTTGGVGRNKRDFIFVVVHNCSV